MNRNPILSATFLSKRKVRKEDKYKEFPLSHKVFSIRLPVHIQEIINNMSTGEIRNILCDVLTDNYSNPEIDNLRLELQKRENEIQELQEQIKSLKENNIKLANALRLLRFQNNIPSEI